MGSESDEFNDKRDRKRKKEDKYDSEKDNVCRDFLRSVCTRGSACKYKHDSGSKQKLSFCHDFQNGYCRRTTTCKFIHSSYEDETYYLETGHLPPHLLNWSNNQRRVSPTDPATLNCKSYHNWSWSEDCGFKDVVQCEYRISDRQSPPLVNIQEKAAYKNHTFPYCRSYLSGACWDDSCKYRHVTRSEFRNIEGRSPTPPINQPDKNGSFDVQDMDGFQDKTKFRDGYYEPKMKRTCMSESERLDNTEVFENNMQYQNRSQPDRSYIMLEEENIMLREKITELKKRIDELQITNEFLLEQNARFRLQQEKNSASLTAMTVPAVTITNSMQGANQIQQNPTPQQMVTAALRTVTASVATVPVSIGAVTPVSIAAVSMAPVQQMQGSVVTIAQQGAPTGEQPQITQQPLPMSISGPTVPLVSYPIMSHTVMQQPAPPPPRLRH